MSKVNPKSLVILLLFALYTYGTGLIGTILANPNTFDIYSQINLPFFAPPAWLFSPVWFVLYGLCALAAWFVWLRGAEMVGNDKPEAALYLFFLTLGLSIFWSPLFFNLQFFGVAFLLLLVVFIFAAITNYQFFRISNWSGFLFAPFTLWVGFATVLNASIVLLN